MRARMMNLSSVSHSLSPLELLRQLKKADFVSYFFAYYQIVEIYLQGTIEALNIQGVDGIYMCERRCMFVLYAYECPILSGYTMQQSTNILPLDSENNQFDF